MKEKLTEGCFMLVLIAFVVLGCTMAVEMFQQGAWVKGIIGVLGVLIFGFPFAWPVSPLCGSRYETVTVCATDRFAYG